MSTNNAMWERRKILFASHTPLFPCPVPASLVLHTWPLKRDSLLVSSLFTAQGTETLLPSVLGCHALSKVPTAKADGPLAPWVSSQYTSPNRLWHSPPCPGFQDTVTSLATLHPSFLSVSPPSVAALSTPLFSWAAHLHYFDRCILLGASHACGLGQDVRAKVQTHRLSCRPEPLLPPHD